MNAARHLQHMGGHFVLLAEGKRPAWRGWNQRRPPLHLIEDHASTGRLGIIPASVGGIVVDVDAGTPETVTAATGAPWAVLGTRRGSHLWYDAPTAPVSRTAWTMGTASGDLIGTGYVKLHGDGLEVLAESIEHRVPAPLQTDLFLRKHPPPGSRKRKAPPPPGREKLTTGSKAVPSAFLEEVQPGARWVSLFDAVRFWSYAQRLGDDRDAWVKRCKAWAVQERQRFPDTTGFPEAEAREVGYYVAVWTWKHREEVWTTPTFDHSPEAQRRRIVKRWHGNARGWTLEQLDERNRRIVAAVAGGRSIREVAKAFGLSRSTVGGIVRG